MEIPNHIKGDLQRGKVAKKCNSLLCGIYDVHQACLESKSGLVHFKIHQQMHWTNWTCLVNEKTSGNSIFSSSKLV